MVGPAGVVRYHGVFSNRATRATSGAATARTSCQGARDRVTSVVGGAIVWHDDHPSSRGSGSDFHGPPLTDLPAPGPTPLLGRAPSRRWKSPRGATIDE